MNRILDLSLVTSHHFIIFLLVFCALAATFAYRAGKDGRYAGIGLAIAVTLGAFVYIPSLVARIGLAAAVLLIGVVGKVDETIKIRPAWQLFWQVCIVGILAISGWVIPYVSNPFTEGVIELQWISVAGVALPAALAAMAWMLLMMNVVNWLDGADGLAGGVTLIAFIALAATAMLPSIYNATGLGLAVVGAAGLLAFFIWNFPPARLYLGTVGSWFVGMYLALAAMAGGGKIATALLILALPVLDAVIVIMKRFLAGRPIWRGDTVSHVHHRLQQKGVSNVQIVLAAMVVTAILALVSIFLTTTAKLVIASVGLAGIAIAGLRLGVLQRMLKRSHDYETANSVPRR